MTFNAAFWLSMALAFAGCAGLTLAGRGKWQGWALGLAVQPVWVAFGLVTHGYGLCLSAALYGTVYTRNLASWRRQRRLTIAQYQESLLVGTVPTLSAQDYASAVRTTRTIG